MATRSATSVPNAAVSMRAGVTQVAEQTGFGPVHDGKERLERIRRREQHTQRRQRAEPPFHGERPGDHVKLTHEIASSRDAQRRKCEKQQKPTQYRHAFPQAAHRLEVARVQPLLQHPGDEKQSAGGQAVVNHLKNRALVAGRVAHRHAEDHKTEVADA